MLPDSDQRKNIWSELGFFRNLALAASPTCLTSPQTVQVLMQRDIYSTNKSGDAAFIYNGNNL
jgi:hypothetical protein